MVDVPRIRAVQSAEGHKYIIVFQGDVEVAAPMIAFVGAPATVAKYLGDRGIFLIGSKMVNGLIEEVAAQTEYEEVDLAHRVGWNGPHFVLPDKDTFSPENYADPVIAIDAVEGKCAKAGKLKDWKRTVAKPLIGQTVPTFMLLLPFMPPILRLSSKTDNVGFEVVGRKGVGKSTLQTIASSVVGSPVAGDGGYGLTWDTTLNAAESTMRDHNDQLIVLDEAALYFAGESPAKQAKVFDDFAFKASLGKDKNRHGSARPGPGSRFSYLSSSNIPLAELSRVQTEASSAAADRLITITVPPSDYGIFNFLPPEYRNSSEYAEALLSGANQHHGTAMRRYLQKLVNERAINETGLKKRISKYMKQFRERAKVNLNSGSTVRVADSFGLVYAAGRIAIEYGALPKSLDCLSAVLACYGISRCGDVTVPFPDRLEEIASSPNTPLLKRGGRELTDKELSRARAVVDSRKGKRQLIIIADDKEVLLPDWHSLLKRPEVRKILERDGEHFAKKIQLKSKGQRTRCYVFNLEPTQKDEDGKG